jgi:uncharacterized paraquat-inducible protein A
MHLQQRQQQTCPFRRTVLLQQRTANAHTCTVYAVLPLLLLLLLLLQAP